jgi:hypothetical protein
VFAFSGHASLPASGGARWSVDCIGGGQVVSFCSQLAKRCRIAVTVAVVTP